jgi:multiple sugar transport system permease protein
MSATSSAPPLVVTRPSRRQRGFWTRRTLIVVFLFLFLIYFLLPLFWLIVSSTKSDADLFSTFGLWFGGEFNLLTNIHDVFAHDGGVYREWLWNTIYYATCSALGAALIATLAGYTFAKFRFPGRNLVFSLVLGSILIPITALAIPTYLLLSNIGLINTPFAVILPSMVNPFGVYLMRVYTEQALPDELLDAARVDGANEIRIFLSVVLRIVAPGFVTVLLLSFVGAWNNYFLPLVMLSKPDYYPLTVGLASWNDLASAGGGSQVLFSIVLTGSLIAVVPLIAAFLLLQRYWQSGLTFGSIKS